MTETATAPPPEIHRQPLIASESSPGRRHLPPGPSLPASLQTGFWLRRPAGFMEMCWRRYGNLFTARLWGFDPGRVATMVFIVDPALAKDVLTGDPDLFLAGITRHAMLSTFGPNSVLLLDGKQHLEHRRRILPPFRSERMAHYHEASERITREELAKWPLNRPFALADRMRDLTLRVILDAVIGGEAAHTSSRLHAAIRGFMDKVSTSVLAEILFSLPFGPGVPGFEKAMREVNEAIYAELAARRADPATSDREDVMSLLILSRDENGRRMTDHELRDELLTLVLAGHESTATSLAWTFEHLLRHPRARDRAVEEAHTEGASDYTNAVIAETLRLNPPFPGVARQLSRPYRLGGFDLPPRTFVVPAIHLMHRRADLYPEPMSFRPERFLNEPPQQQTWLTFSRGIRQCPGRSFSLAEMQVIVGTILRHAHLEPARPRPEPIRRRGMILPPAHGTQVILRSRRPY